MAAVGSVQICGSKLTDLEIEDICGALDTHLVKVLSLRECEVKDKQFDQLMLSLGRCRTILHLNLNVGVVATSFKVESLCGGLLMNRSLTALLIHGSPIGDEGFQLLSKALLSHPHIVTLDVGDCNLDDSSLHKLAQLLPSNGAKPGLQDLTLSGNTKISKVGWMKFFMALASPNELKALHLDYNILGDQCVACLTIAMAASPSLKKVDLEATGMTEHAARLLLHLVKTYPLGLTQLVLLGNAVNTKTIEEIEKHLKEPGLITKQFYQADQAKLSVASPVLEEQEIESTEGEDDSEEAESEGSEEESESEEDEDEDEEESTEAESTLQSMPLENLAIRNPQGHVVPYQQHEPIRVAAAQRFSAVAAKPHTSHSERDSLRDSSDLYAVPHRPGQYTRVKNRKKEENNVDRIPISKPSRGNVSKDTSSGEEEENLYESIDKARKPQRAVPAVPPRDTANQHYSRFPAAPVHDTKWGQSEDESSSEEKENTFKSTDKAHNPRHTLPIVPPRDSSKRHFQPIRPASGQRSSGGPRKVAALLDLKSTYELQQAYTAALTQRPDGS